MGSTSSQCAEAQGIRLWGISANISEWVPGVRSLPALSGMVDRAKVAKISVSERPETVTQVTGTFCNPCLRAGPKIFGGADGIRTHDLLDAIEARSQLRHGPTGE